MNERRQAARLAESVSFKFAYQGYDISTVTLNLSSNGLLCRTNHPVPAMTKLALVLLIPSERFGEKPREIRAKAVVVRSDDDEKPGYWQLAIFFTDITDSQKKVLNHYIHNHLAKRS